jgi:hypothetical protein
MEIPVASVSESMAALAGHPHDGRVLPLVVGGEVTAVLYAWGVRQGEVLELLTQVAAMVGQAFPPAESPPPSAVRLAGESVCPTSWEGLSPEEQEVHLRAQRFARVRVAEMRLAEGAAVQSGLVHRDLYGALRGRIDAARETMRHSFFAPCASMVDYIHVELVRALAHDDPTLLGEDYPGPLA